MFGSVWKAFGNRRQKVADGREGLGGWWAAVHRGFASGSRDVADAAIESAPMSAPDFETLLQPIIELASGEVAGFEVLNRVKGESTREYLSKGPLALSLSLERSMIETINSAETLLPEGVWLSFNVSGRFIRATSDVLDLPVGRNREIYMEISGDSIGGREELQSVLEELGRRIPEGCQIAVDSSVPNPDTIRVFGTAIAGMVKVAPSWVKGIAGNPVHLGLLESAVRIAAANGVKVVAEGIERTEDLEALKIIGVSYGQGFLLGRPVRVDLESGE